MKRDWLWDRKISVDKAKRVLSNPKDPSFLRFAALFLSRKNVPKEVFEDLAPPAFCRNWQKIKRVMRQDRWNDPRIVFWQAVYESLLVKYRKRGINIVERKRGAAPISEFCKSVGEKIRVFRKEKGFTQHEIAKRINISQQMISRIESGRENMSLLTLQKIMKSLGIQMKLLK